MNQLLLNSGIEADQKGEDRGSRTHEPRFVVYSISHDDFKFKICKLQHHIQFNIY